LILCSNQVANDPISNEVERRKVMVLDEERSLI
jgi:hypothetical protein